MAAARSSSSKRLRWAVALLALGAVVTVVLSWRLLRSPEAASASPPELAVRAPGSAVPAPVASDAPAEDWERLVRTTAPGDFAALMRRAFRIKDPARRQSVLSALAVRWMNDNLRSFVAFLDELDSEGEYGDSWKALTPALLDCLPKIGDRAALSSYLGVVVERLVAHAARGDAPGTLQWARQWLLEDTLEAALASIIRACVQGQPELALQIFAEMTSPLRRMEAIAQLGSRLVKQDLPSALAWSQALPSTNEQARGMNSILREYSAQRPVDAAQMLHDYDRALQAKYVADVAADKATFMTRPKDEFTDPETPDLSKNKDSPNGEVLSEAAMAIASQLAQTDPVAALQWSEALVDSRVRQAAVSAALLAWSDNQPEQAVGRYLQDYANQPTLASSLYSGWAESAPAAAAASALQIGNPEILREAAGGVVAGWLNGESDLPAIGAWIQQLPAGPARDAAAGPYLDALSSVNPQAAWSQALQIQDPSIRRDLLPSTFASLLSPNPNLARAALASGALSPAENRQLTKLYQSATGDR